MTAIDIQNLSYNYRSTRAIDGIDLQLASGRIVGLLGENGCGKTTLLKVLSGVLAGYEGDVRIAGHVPGPASKALVSFLPDESFLDRRERVSYWFDYFSDFYADFDQDKALNMVEFFGLQKSMRLSEMSKGMREKVQVALAMSRDAKVFLLDEPISGVDPSSRQVILDGIVKHLSVDSLVLIATHLIHDLEPVLDSVVMMRHGKVLLQGDVDDLRASRSASIDQIFREEYSWSAN